MKTTIDTMPEISTRKYADQKGKGIPVYLYFRVSTQMQDFDRQVKIVQDYLDNELGRGYQVVGEFTDKLSGQDANRPSYREMWSNLKANQAKVVLCSSMDRFGRNLAELLRAVAEAKKHDIELRFIKDRLIINNEESFTQQLLVQLLGAVAEFESNIASERVKQKVAIKRENPFWWTGQKPKIAGEDWQALVDMYYAKKPRQVSGKQIYGVHKGSPRFSKTETSHQYTIQDIATHFSMSKGALSDVVNRYVAAEIMTHRSPKKAKKVAKVQYVKLPSHMRPDTKKKGSHSILHPHYWPENIRKVVAKKFGDYKKLDKGTDIDQSKAAWRYGKKVYYGWMKSYVKSVMENADIFAFHKDLLSGGDFGGAISPVSNMSKKELESLDVNELHSRGSQ